MRKPLFIGVCTALVTPFLDDKVNYPLLEQLIKRQIDAGVQTIVLCGTTGESPTLSDSEKLQIFHRAKQYVGDNCKIIAGTGYNSTLRTIELSKAAQNTGVDGLLLVSPYYNKGNMAGLIAHFNAVAENVDIPIVLYNVPSRTGCDLSVETYQSLAATQNIVGVKEASNDISKITRIRNACNNEFQIWTGNDDLIVPTIALGGIGVISVLSNLFPEETVAMTNAALNNNFHLAATLQAQLSNLIELLFSEVNPIPVKYAMRYVGYDCGNCRLPLGPLSTSNKEKIDAYFR